MVRALPRRPACAEADPANVKHQRFVPVAAEIARSARNHSLGRMPKDTVVAGTVEVTDSGNLIRGTIHRIGRMRAEVDAAGPVAVVDQPLVNVACGRVLPKDVARA